MSVEDAAGFEPTLLTAYGDRPLASGWTAIAAWRR
jgi:hypothetical protein